MATMGTVLAVLAALAAATAGAHGAWRATLHRPPLAPPLARTSAAVFDARGRLVTQLWAGRAVPPGPLSVAAQGLRETGASTCAAMSARVAFYVAGARAEPQAHRERGGGGGGGLPSNGDHGP